MKEGAGGREEGRNRGGKEERKRNEVREERKKEGSVSALQFS